MRAMKLRALVLTKIRLDLRRRFRGVVSVHRVHISEHAIGMKLLRGAAARRDQNARDRKKVFGFIALTTSLNMALHRLSVNDLIAIIQRAT